jgi:hypothetical protein
MLEDIMSRNLVNMPIKVQCCDSPHLAWAMLGAFNCYKLLIYIYLLY